LQEQFGQRVRGEDIGVGIQKRPGHLSRGLHTPHICTHA
jgi:hypothetical protein